MKKNPGKGGKGKGVGKGKATGKRNLRFLKDVK